MFTKVDFMDEVILIANFSMACTLEKPFEKNKSRLGQLVGLLDGVVLLLCESDTHIPSQHFVLHSPEKCAVNAKFFEQYFEWASESR